MMTAPGADVVNALFAKAIEHHQRGRLGEAEAIYRQILATDPNHLQTLQFFGTLALQSRRPQEAVELLGRALALNDRDPGLYNNIGLAFAALSRFEDAATHFGRALELAPNFIDSLVGLGNALAALQRNREAIAQYRRALALKPDNPRALYNLGNALREEGELDEAVAVYRKARALAPGAVEILVNLAAVLKQQEQFDEAQQCLQQALSLRPQDASAHVNMGNLHATQGRFDQALAHYIQALKAQPDSVDAHLNLGHALVKQGRAAEALGPLEAGLAIAPDHPQMQLYLCEAVYFLSLADQETALAHAKRLLAAHGDKPLVRRGLSGLLGLSADAANDSDYARVLFDKFAEGFDKTLSELGYLPMARSIVEALEFEERGVGLDILDAGCGTGLCAEFLKPAARTLTGVDLSQKMLARARARGAYDRLECSEVVAFMQQSGSAFDVVLSSDVLGYIGDSESFLRAAHHALRPGGKVAISAERLETDSARTGQVGLALAPSGRYQHTRAYLEKAFADAGFRVRNVIESVMRREVGKPVPAWIVVGEKPA